VAPQKMDVLVFHGVSVCIGGNQAMQSVIWPGRQKGSFQPPQKSLTETIGKVGLDEWTGRLVMETKNTDVILIMLFPNAFACEGPFRHASPIRKGALAVCGFILLASVTFVCTSAAATARTLTLAELCKSAEIIAEVTVQDVQSYWAAPGGAKAIRTRVTFGVDQAVKGSPGQSFALDFLGGTVAGRALQVPGVPRFSPGERYVIFCAAPGKALVCPVLGLDQGAMRVVHDDQSNVDRVFRNWGQPVSASENFESRVPAVPGVTTRDYLRSADTVDRFLERVRQATNQ